MRSLCKRETQILIAFNLKLESFHEVINRWHDETVVRRIRTLRKNKVSVFEQFKVIFVPTV